MAGNVGNMWSRHSCVKSGKPACFKNAGFDMLCKGTFKSTVGYQMSTLYCGGGFQKYFLHAQMSIQCVECAFTVIYLLLVARNL